MPHCSLIAQKNKSYSTEKSILLRVQPPNRKRFTIGLKQTVEPEKWDAKLGIILAETPKEKKQNLLIQKLLEKAEEEVNNCIINGIPITKERIQHKLFGTGLGAKPQTLEELWEKWLEASGVKPQTAKQRRSSLVHLLTFSKEVEKITLSEVNGFTLNKFGKWLLAKGLEQTTVLKQIKTFKTFLKYLYESGQSENNTFTRGYSLKLASSGANKISLTPEEVKQIYNTEYSSKALERVSRLFLIALSGGLRYNELKKISKECIRSFRGQQYLEIESDKTQKASQILIAPNLEKLLNYFAYDVRGNTPSIQVYNRQLKRMGMEAGLTRTIYFKKGGEVIEKPLHDLLSSHKVRFSLATLAHESGIPLPDIKTMLNHSTLEMTLQYQKLNQLAAAEKVSQVTEKLLVREIPYKEGAIIEHEGEVYLCRGDLHIHLGKANR